MKADRPMNEYENAMAAAISAILVALAYQPNLAEKVYQELRDLPGDAARDGNINGAALLEQFLDRLPSFPRDD